MPPNRYRLTVPIIFHGSVPGQEILLPLGTVIVLINMANGRARWAVAEATTRRIARTFPSEVKRERWITKNAEAVI